MNAKTLFAGLAVLPLLSACRKADSGEAESARFLATTPVVIDTSYEKQYVAQIRSIRNIEIRAQEKGFLKEIPIDEGRTVRAGQLLFRIMPKVYGAELQKAVVQATRNSRIFAYVDVSESESLDNKTNVAGRGSPRVQHTTYRGGLGDITGAGLGLPIAAWIADAHGGTLTLAASGPDGSTFELVLPGG
ncbi:MAG: hypothetical protein ACK5XT_00305 [Gemmatimonas sp.]|uniref:hypothetical protein n=1 Tax=Gemmatimonas sp. TaxID=1962908 RepID=UPI00391F57E3